MEARDRFWAVFMLSEQEIEGKDRGSDGRCPGVGVTRVAWIDVTGRNGVG